MPLTRMVDLSKHRVRLGAQTALTRKRTEDIVDMLRTMKTKDVAAKLGCSINAIHQRMHYNGISIKELRRGKKKPEKTVRQRIREKEATS
jgi:uncharacterized protein YjcR